jgi:hypothetical protein
MAIFVYKEHAPVKGEGLGTLGGAGKGKLSALYAREVGRGVHEYLGPGNEREPLNRAIKHERSQHERDKEARYLHS